MKGRIASRSKAPHKGRTWPLSAETQKWFDQNHTRRSAKPISALSALSRRARFLEIDLLRHAGLLLRFGVGGLRRRRRGHIRLGHFRLGLAERRSHRIRRGAFSGFLRGVGGVACRRFVQFVAGAARQPLGLAFLPEIVGRTRGFAGAQQVVIDDLPGTGLVEFRQQRRARVFIKGRETAGLRREAETMQKSRRLYLRIERHARFSSLAAPPHTHALTSPILRR